MKISTLIIDDDSDSRLILRNYLETECPDMAITGEASTVAEGIAAANRLKPELLLLDISLPDGTGFDLLQQLPERNFEVIFITAHNHFAVQAFRLAAIDYLLKPVAFSELEAALQRVKDRAREKYFATHWQTLLHNSVQTEQYDRKLAISTVEGYLFVALRDIVRLESSSNYTHFYFVNGKKLVSSRTLGYYEEALPPEKFCRIHHSHLVNTDHVERFIKAGAGGTVVMKDGMELTVSQRKKEEVLKLLTK